MKRVRVKYTFILFKIIIFLTGYILGVLGGVLKSGDIFLSLPSKDLFLNVRGLPEFGEEFKDNGSQQNHESWCNKGKSNELFLTRH